MLMYEKTFADQDTARILKAGCGKGKIIFFCINFCRFFNPGKTVLLYG